MSIKYFKNFPLVQYGDLNLRNIMLKASVARELITSYDFFYPYTIQSGDTLTSIAFNYYGSVDHVWLILIANDITDPYYDWPLEDSVFDEYIIKKYGSMEAAMNINNAKYYRNPNRTYLMTSTTYDHSSTSERTGWTPLANYDYEFEINQAKRNIKLIDRSIAVNLSFELEKLLRKVNRETV